MAIFGFGTKDQPATVINNKQKAKNSQLKNADDDQQKTAGGSSQADEAKAILAKMAAKKEAGDCPFC